MKSTGWAKDAALWAKAHEAVKPDWSKHSDPTAVVCAVYMKMGGKLAPQEEADCVKFELKNAVTQQEADGWEDQYKEAIAAAALGALQKPVASREAFYAFRESDQVDEEKREVTCILITEGPGNARDRRFYAREFIEDVAKKYEGARSYLNHASVEERQARSEGDIKNLCGFFHNLRTSEVRDKLTGNTVLACIAEQRFDKSEAGNEGFAKAKAQIEYSRMYPASANEYCGLSINGYGEPDGTVMIEGQKWTKIVKVGFADSVDVVTRPARGGAFLALTESADPAHNLSRGEDMKVRNVMAAAAEVAELSKKLTRESDAGKKAAIQADLEKAELKLTEASKAMRESGAAADDKEMEEAMASFGPKAKDETEEAFKGRLDKFKAMMGKKSKEANSLENMTAEQLKESMPAVYEKLLTSIKATESTAGADVAKLQVEVAKLTESERTLKLELRIKSDMQEAKELLESASLPKGTLNPEDLINMSTAEKKAEIAKVKAIIEAAGGGSGFNPARPAGGGRADNLDDSIANLKKDLARA